MSEVEVQECIENLKYLFPDERRRRITESLTRVEKDRIILAGKKNVVAQISILGDIAINLKENGWHREPFSGYFWGLDFHLSGDFFSAIPGSDIKNVWELNRCHHLLSLAKAYVVEDANEQYAREFKRSVDSWMAENPWKQGANWACPMEVSIRSMNIVWALAIFRPSVELDDCFLSKVLSLLLVHFRHVALNLENDGRVAGNHYICNLLALTYAGYLFPRKVWLRRLFRKIIPKCYEQTQYQVYKDGVNFESSIPYHRLVTEAILHICYIVKLYIEVHAEDKCDRCQFVDFSAYQALLSTANKMCEFICSYTYGECAAPQIGDNDSGRILPIGYDRKDRLSHRHLVSFADALFCDIKPSSNLQSHSEETLWLFDSYNKAFCSSYSVQSSAYPEAGFYIMRTDEDFLMVHNGGLGTGGKGTHTHNDNLSFVLNCDSSEFIVDAGTYSYSSDIGLRERFRSTAMHNTVQIDGVEQNNFCDDRFALVANCECRNIMWETNDKTDTYVGEIRYLSESIIHRRTITYFKMHSVWQIDDCFANLDGYRLVWHFILHPDIHAELQDSFALLTSGTTILKLDASFGSGELMRIVDVPFSPSYGIKSTTKAIEIELDGSNGTYCTKISRYRTQHPESLSQVEN